MLCRSRWFAPVIVVGLAGCFASIDRTKIDRDVDRDAADGTDATVSDCAEAVVCDGFERDEALVQPWSGREGDPAAEVKTSARRAHDGSRSLEVTMIAANGGSGGGSLRTRPSPPAERAALRYSVFVASDFRARPLSLASLYFDAGGGHTVELYLSIGGDGRAHFTLRENGASADASYVKIGSDLELVRGRWADVSMEVDLVSAPATGTFTYDGVTVVDHAPLPRTTPPAPVSLLFGLTYVGAGDVVTCNFDDVMFRVQSAP